MFSIKAYPAHFTFFDSYLEIALKSKLRRKWLYKLLLNLSDIFPSRFLISGTIIFLPSRKRLDKYELRESTTSNLYTHSREFVWTATLLKMDPFYTHVVNVTCQKLQKCWLLSVAYLLCICRMYLKPKLKKY